MFSIKLSTFQPILLIPLLLVTCFLPVRPASSADEAETLAILVKTIGEMNDEAVQANLLKGMLYGLSGRRNLPAPDGWKELNAKLKTSPNGSIRDLASKVAAVFGDAEALREAMATLTDKDGDLPARRAALRSLSTQRYEKLPSELENLLNEPAMRLDAIRAFGASGKEDSAGLLLSRYKDFQPAEQRAVIETLATRKNYAKALVAAIGNGTVKKEAIPSYIARSLRDIIGKEFTKVYGEVPEVAKNTKQLIAKYKKMITPEAISNANASRGRAIFKKTCGACHLIYGTGGKIGPDLTGSNRANLDYFLLNSLDPSYDVPEGYRMVIIQTEDGRVLNGVIGAEDNQRIVLKTVDQPEVVIAKSDIERRKVSEKSMMPDGQLQELKPQQIFDLVKYLRTTAQVELP